MIISCESCHARFRLADEKLKPGGTRVRCSKCQQVFTVLPPEPAPAEEAIDFGAFNMERVSDEETPPGSPDMAAPAAGDDAAAESGVREFDFGAMASTAEPEAPIGAAAGQYETPDQTETVLAGSTFGEFSFDEDPTDRKTASAFAATPTDDEMATSADSSLFDFDNAAPSDSADFAAEPNEPTPAEFPFAADNDTERFVFDEQTEAAVKSESFVFEEAGEGSLFEDEPAFGEKEATTWEESGATKGLSFDFDEPNFADEAKSPLAESGSRTEQNFGEIDLGETPQFNPRPEPPASAPRPDAAVATAPPPPAPSQRTATSRPQTASPVPAPRATRKSSSRVYLLLILLFLLLGGVGTYLYLQSDGQQLVEGLLGTLKGEQPVAPMEQRIGLTITGSSYVDNREVGQLLVIQGTATNNFSGVRSAITVKGVLVDADGKMLQQQTIFCGNYLSEERLRTMKYAQIEEAMNNQFGDSLANMNVKPGNVIRFTVVFRNLPKNLVNINVEVVDSKPGGL